MIQELINLNGYGQFVWPAFIFTFLNCYLLYVQTIKELKKQEKLLLNELKQLESKKIILNKTIKQDTRRILSDNPVY